jgi:signal transduction histidine kinase/ActR/RegA family two-component response regulator
MRRRNNHAGCGVAVALLAACGAHFSSSVAFSQTFSRTIRIGAGNAYPYHVMGDNGQARGLAVDVLEQAARRRGIRIVWVDMRGMNVEAALASGKIDVWPLTGSGILRVKGMYLTDPWLRNTQLVAALDPEAVGEGAWSRVRSLSLLDSPTPRRLAETFFARAELRTFATREEALSAMCRGETEAAIIEARSLQWLTLQGVAGCDFSRMKMGGFPRAATELGIASTAEASSTAMALREEIDRMAVDGMLGRILQPWAYYYANESETIHLQQRLERRLEVMVLALCAVAAGMVVLVILYCRLRQARRVAEQANAAKSRFLASVSHDIRTPLNGVVGMADALAKSRLEAASKEQVEVIRSCAVALQRLLGDVLDLARIEQGRLQLEAAPFSITKLIEDVAGAARALAEAKNLELRAEGGEGIPRLVGDELRIRQVLTNLVDNAIKFTSEGQIVIRAACERQNGYAQLRISVEDTGMGVAPNTRERIFESFEQADASILRRYGGTGLGLAISRELVRLMGGELDVESRPGERTVFWFELRLPCAPEPVRHEERTAAERSPAFEAARVLVVDDNGISQRVAETLLTQLGCRVDKADDGSKALNLVQERSYDLVLMDCLMPGMNGWDTTRAIRAAEHGRRIPIIALTASVMSGDRQRCVDAGMDDFLAKPIDMETLRRTLEKWLSTKAS